MNLRKAEVIDRSNSRASFSAKRHLSWKVVALLLGLGYSTSLYAEVCAVPAVQKEIAAAELQNSLGDLVTKNYFHDARFYDSLLMKPKYAKQLIQKWYGVRFARKFIPLLSQGKRGDWALLADPAIASRAHEFLRFREAQLNAKPGLTTLELRQAFAKYLGQAHVYRAMVLTDAEAAAIKKNGLPAPGVWSKTGNPGDWLVPDSHGPMADLTNRVTKNDGKTGFAISVTEHIPVAMAASAPSLEGAAAGKDIYLFTLEIPEIDLVRETGLTLSFPAVGELRKAQATFPYLNVTDPKKTDLSYLWQMQTVESFAYVDIPPEQIKRVVKRTDRGWTFMIWSKRFGDINAKDRPLRTYERQSWDEEN